MRKCIITAFSAYLLAACSGRFLVIAYVSRRERFLTSAIGSKRWKNQVKEDDPEMIKRLVQFCDTGDYRPYKTTLREVEKQKDASGVLARISVDLHAI